MEVNLFFDGKWTNVLNNEISEENKEIVEKLVNGTPLNVLTLLAVLDGLDVININEALEKFKQKSNL
ncbi:hypothetical protein WKH56_20055 [Priestia sp. SB1]|uniref:hypothetical protein n=1 Tax=Priestia sp. SB1 TaxID=3132359 RepID=UPI00316C1B2D